MTLRWRHNERDGISNHRRLDCLLNRFVHAQIKESIKAPRHWPLWWEFTGHRWIPRTKGQSHGNYFQLMTSSCVLFILVVCGDTLYHENSDDIFSPNYPDLYPDNAHCIYTIHRSSSTPTLLRSIYFHLEYQRSCYYDYVKVGLLH